MTHHFHTFNMITNGGPSDEHKVMVESGCALTPAYGPKFVHHLWEMFPAENGVRNAIFIVSEGFEVSPAEMDKFRRALCCDPGAGNMIWGCFCDGVSVTLEGTKTNQVRSIQLVAIADHLAASV